MKIYTTSFLFQCTKSFLTIYFEHFFVIENKSITEQIVTHLNKMISFKKKYFLKQLLLRRFIPFYKL